MSTLEEVVEKLLHAADTEDLIELLDIDAEELLDRFEDRLENRMTQVKMFLEDTYES